MLSIEKWGKTTFVLIANGTKQEILRLGKRASLLKKTFIARTDTVNRERYARTLRIGWIIQKASLK